EAEVEVLRAMSIAPTDLRGLKLLALVRFKLGRLDEARSACRELAVALPHDAGIRLKLGLIALKLDGIDEAIDELEMAVRLAPDDSRPWSYLGFAYARRGERTRAAAAFRRGGEDHHAAEVEQCLAPQGVAAAVSASEAPVGSGLHETFSAPPGSHAAVVALESAFDLPSAVDVGDHVHGSGHEHDDDRVDLRPPRTDPDRLLGNFPGNFFGQSGSVPVASLIGYAVSRLEPPAGAGAAWVGATARLPIGDEIFVRRAAAVACTGGARWEVAHQRIRGRDTVHPLGGSGAMASEEAGQPFFRVTGRGEVFVGAAGGRLVPLLLENDILYVREDRVLAFDGKVQWEYGHVPRGGIRMLQFRGQGVVVISVAGEPGAVKVTPERSLFVSAPHLLGWIGRVVAHGTGESGSACSDGVPRLSGGDLPNLPNHGISCEGEGVVLVDVRGEGRGGRDRS
ncbi:MAG: AIM24 family protein, partial [Polyangia bacterium]